MSFRRGCQSHGGFSIPVETGAAQLRSQKCCESHHILYQKEKKKYLLNKYIFAGMCSTTQ